VVSGISLSALVVGSMSCQHNTDIHDTDLYVTSIPSLAQSAQEDSAHYAELQKVPSDTEHPQLHPNPIQPGGTAVPSTQDAICLIIWNALSRQEEVMQLRN